jgi:hypothetical protein
VTRGRTPELSLLSCDANVARPDRCTSRDVHEEWPMTIVWAEGLAGCTERYPSSLEVAPGGDRRDDDYRVPQRSHGAPRRPYRAATADEGNPAAPKYTVEYTWQLSYRVATNVQRALKGEASGDTRCGDARRSALGARAGVWPARRPRVPHDARLVQPPRCTLSADGAARRHARRRMCGDAAKSKTVHFDHS